MIVHTYRIALSQNGWEYTGYAYVKCKHIHKKGDNGVVADGMEIYFDEEIGSIDIVSDMELY